MIKIKAHLTIEHCEMILLGLFVCSPLLRSVFRTIFGSETIVDILNIIVLYIPAAYLLILKPKRFFKLDFVILFLFLLIFFGLTYILHPEYEYVYTREQYGVLDYVFIPYEALYGYLFFRFVSDPQKMLNVLRISGYFMFVYFIHALINAKRRGYWPGVAGTNSDARFSYSISYGYEVLFFALVFFYCALKYKRKNDIIAFLVSLFLIFSGGSRGPILFIGIFFILYLMIELQNSKKKFQIISFVTLVFGLFYMCFDKLLRGVSLLLSRFGFSSRFITKLEEDSITSDSGRSIIWDAAVQMIKDNPLGYGAMGSRHVIYKIVDAGYPHNMFLEILIDFGVIFGGLIIAIIIIKSFLMLFASKYGEWKSVFLCMFCASCPLLVSLSYWGHPAFWAAIAICVNAYIDNKTRGKRSVLNKWKRLLKAATQISS